jgi:hypothetical protein
MLKVTGTNSNLKRFARKRTEKRNEQLSNRKRKKNAKLAPDLGLTMLTEKRSE